MKMLNVFSYTASQIKFYYDVLSHRMKNNWKSEGRTEHTSIKNELDELDKLEVELGKVNPESKNSRYKKLLRYKLKELKTNPQGVGNDEGLKFLEEMFDFAKNDLKRIAIVGNNPNLSTIDDYFDDFADIILMSSTKLDVANGSIRYNSNHEDIKSLGKARPDLYDEFQRHILLNNEDDFRKPMNEWNANSMRSYQKLLEKSLDMYDKTSRFLQMAKKKYGHNKENPYAEIAGFGRKMVKFSNQMRGSRVRPGMFALKNSYIVAIPALIMLWFCAEHNSDVRKLDDAKRFNATAYSRIVGRQLEIDGTRMSMKGITNHYELRKMMHAIKTNEIKIENMAAATNGNNYEMQNLPLDGEFRAMDSIFRAMPFLGKPYKP